VNDAAAPAPAPARRLCVCADDFGLSEGVQQAVLTLIEQGVVNATSCMVQRAGWRSGAEQLRRLSPHAADIGLHLDLTRIDESAREASLGALIARCYTGRADRQALAAQIDEQLDRFDQALGRAPDHVDGHRHVHQLPVVRELLLEALQRRYATQRPWLRSTRPGTRGSVPPKQRLIHALGGPALAREARQQGLPMSGALLGVYDFTGGEDHYAQQLAGWLRDGDDGDVLMCHPATSRAPGDAVADARLWEFTALSRLAPRCATARGDVALGPLSATLRG
jgi:predicted glycoside hydrolase/deacetylase ChbG (UPF0249 family)